MMKAKDAAFILLALSIITAVFLNEYHDGYLSFHSDAMLIVGMMAAASLGMYLVAMRITEQIPEYELVRTNQLEERKLKKMPHPAIEIVHDFIVENPDCTTKGIVKGTGIPEHIVKKALKRLEKDNVIEGALKRKR